MKFFKNKKQFYSLKNLSHNSFYIGIFFLPSALPISAVFLLISIINVLFKSGNTYLKNKWNFPIIVFFALMTFSCIRNSLDFVLNENFSREISSIWLDLFNWFPLFLLFWSSQIYTDNEIKREKCARIILISTLPVFASCIGQYWLGWQGPISTLNGLIVWFMRPISETENLTGLFSNSNYLGCWLSVLFPFAAVSLSYKKNDLKKFCIILLNLIFIYLLLLTSSRNSLVSILITLSFLKLKIIFFTLLIFLLTPLIWNYFFPKLFFDFGKSFLPINLINRFDFGTNIKFFSSTRFEIWNKTLFFISNRPLLGWGSGLFPILYISSTGLFNAQHAHNLPLHLAFTYGVPLAISITAMVFVIVLKSYRVIFKNNSNNNNINKAWFLSSLVMIYWHISDIPYFDGKISILSWILLSGLCSIIKESEEKKITILN